jgi:hypothetical protein
VHRTDEVKATAAILGVTLHYIPPGLTGEFQPNDQRLFDLLKAQGKFLFHT